MTTFNQLLATVVRRHPAPVTLAEAIADTGLPMGEAARGLSALCARGVLTSGSDGLRLAPPYDEVTLTITFAPAPPTSGPSGPGAAAPARPADPATPAA